MVVLVCAPVFGAVSRRAIAVLGAGTMMRLGWRRLHWAAALERTCRRHGCRHWLLLLLLLEIGPGRRAGSCRGGQTCCSRWPRCALGCCHDRGRVVCGEPALARIRKSAGPSFRTRGRLAPRPAPCPEGCALAQRRPAEHKRAAGTRWRSERSAHESRHCAKHCDGRGWVRAVFLPIVRIFVASGPSSRPDARIRNWVRYKRGSRGLKCHISSAHAMNAIDPTALSALPSGLGQAICLLGASAAINAFYRRQFALTRAALVLVPEDLAKAVKLGAIFAALLVTVNHWLVPRYPDILALCALSQMLRYPIEVKLSCRPIREILGPVFPIVAAACAWHKGGTWDLAAGAGAVLAATVLRPDNDAVILVLRMRLKPMLRQVLHGALMMLAFLQLCELNTPFHAAVGLSVTGLYVVATRGGAMLRECASRVLPATF
eukprot:m.301813 g.301813  ORF g.301813 m.301813 type:complete len:432 (+) comp14934_c0_seq1:1003-2298(+)